MLKCYYMYTITASNIFDILKYYTTLSKMVLKSLELKFYNSKQKVLKCMLKMITEELTASALDNCIRNSLATRETNSSLGTYAKP